MASTGAVMYLRPTISSLSAAARVTGAQMFLALRDSTAQFTSSGSGIASNTNLRNKRAMLPSRSVPLMDASGQVNQDWWNYFSFINGTFLRARIGPTMSDLADAITSSQANSSSSEAQLASLTQQVSAVAQSVQALREVAVTAGTPGAAAVPVPPTEPQVTATGATGGGDSGAGTGGGGDAGGGGD